METQKGEAILMRHLDKGEWQYNEAELKAAMPEDEANLLITVLKENGYEGKNLPLQIDGLRRGINAGAEIFAQLPQRSVLVTIDSKKPRADLSEAIISARIGQMESKSQQDKETAKRVDMVHVEEAELSRLMQDEDTGTWDDFAAMMKPENITERAAIARQVNTIDQPGAKVPGSESLAQAADRYREVIKRLRSKITSEQVPVAVLGIGHSGPLTVMKHRQEGRDLMEADVPYFAQMFVFDENDNFNREQEVTL